MLLGKLKVETEPNKIAVKEKSNFRPFSSLFVFFPNVATIRKKSSFIDVVLIPDNSTWWSPNTKLI